MSDSKCRCPWSLVSPLDTRYHDDEWGVPVRDDDTLFEYLTLEGAQAGLSWTTVLKKRERYRAVFEGFSPQRVAQFTATDEQRLLEDPGIIRNRLKIRSAVQNAQAVLALQSRPGGFADFLWSFVDGEPTINHWSTAADVPSETAASQAMSKALKQHGFNFVGPTICYALMQATGMVNDHLIDCFRHAELS